MSIAGRIDVLDASSRRLMPGQIRAARGVLDWSRGDLAAAAGLSVSSVKRAEDASPETASRGVHATLRCAFEAQGLRFMADEAGGSGLWLGPGRRPQARQPAGANSAASASRTRTGFSQRGTVP